MSDDLFEVSFCGEIRAGENPEDVKARVGKIFKANEGKIAQLFSGNRIVIRKNIDQQTAAKYKTALNRAGAECEINSMTPVPSTEAESPSTALAEKPVNSPTETAPVSASARAVDYGEVGPPPQTDPLGIKAEQIEDLSLSVAPVGSVLQDGIGDVAEPDIDIADFDVAPVGSTIGSGKKEIDPPPPDTSGISMAD